MFGVGPVELFVAALLAGATTAPPGSSPSPQATIERSAPEKCLFYFSSAGMPEPDAGSTNHTEQLLANKDVQTFFSELKTQIADGIRQAGAKNEELAAWSEAGVLPLAELAVRRPFAVYVERCEIHNDRRPEIAAAMIVHCGDRTAAVQKTVERIVTLATRQGGTDRIEDVQVAGVSLHRLATDELQLDWGFDGEYFLLAIGKQTSADLLSRIHQAGSPPDWLIALKKQAGIQRVGTIGYLNGAGVWAAIEPHVSDPKVRGVIESFGLNKLVSAGSVSGLDGEGMVTREFVDFGGWPAEWSEQKPLTAGDLKPVPENAEFATVARLDVGWIYRQAIDAAVQLNPAAEIKENIAQAEQQLGFQVEADLLASLGDLWTVHSAPGGGMLPMSGLVMTVTVRDQQKLAKVHDKLMALGQVLLEQQAEPPFSIETKTVRGVEVHHLQPHGPIAWDPAWTVFDGRLVVAATLQGLKFHIARDGKKSLAELPAVAKRLQAGPMMLSYQDTRSAVRQMFAAIQTFGPMLIGQLAAAGINVELPTLPDLEAIEPHILPRIDTTRRTSNGIESESFSTVPLAANNVGSPAAAGMLVALVLPAVQAAREAARRNVSANNLHQLTLAMLNYSAQQGKFPAAAIYDAKGKPLLSWRVAMLPNLGEEQLYSQFHLDEPWDSEHNKPLIEKMPTVYSSPWESQRIGKTIYVVPTGKGTMFFGEKGTALGQIADGTSNTILVVQVDAEHAVHWTKPEDLTVDKKQPAAGLAIEAGGRITVARADGSIARLPVDIDAVTFWSFFTRAGREQIVWPPGD